jgi:hypothetical protein
VRVPPRPSRLVLAHNYDAPLSLPPILCARARERGLSPSGPGGSGDFVDALVQVRGRGGWIGGSVKGVEGWCSSIGPERLALGPTPPRPPPIPHVGDPARAAPAPFSVASVECIRRRSIRDAAMPPQGGRAHLSKLFARHVRNTISKHRAVAQRGGDPDQMRDVQARAVLWLARRLACRGNGGFLSVVRGFVRMRSLACSTAFRPSTHPACLKIIFELCASHPTSFPAVRRPGAHHGSLRRRRPSDITRRTCL